MMRCNIRAITLAPYGGESDQRPVSLQKIITKLPQVATDGQATTEESEPTCHQNDRIAQ